MRSMPGWLLFVASAALIAGCGSPIVGYECEKGLKACGGVCVDTSTSTEHCGGCNIVCDVGIACVDGVCGGVSTDGGADGGPDGSVDGGTDGGTDGGSDGGTDGGADGGMCTGCSPAEACCSSECVDLDTDPDHCGMCGNECASGICDAGTCDSGLTGHVVLIGHDYQDSRSGQNRLAGNSVFIAPGAPVQVLVYEGDAVSGSITGVDAAIDQVSTELGRSWQRNVAADATDVITQLPFANVFLLYSQQGATDGALQALGSMWSAALSDFIGDGGVVVVFDGGGTHAGTYQVLEEAGLLSVAARAALSAQVVTVVAPGDAVAPNVPGSYLGETETVSFTFAGAGTVVVQHGTGPVVIHRTF